MDQLKKEKIDEDVIDVYRQIKQNGYEIYLVGGGVRDLLMDRAVKDWDMTTSATPEQIQQIFPDSFYDNSFGTVGIPIKNGDSSKVIEVTTFRTERGYEDFRHPGEVSWGKTLEEDVVRRDFSVNALAITIEGDSLEVIDLVGGVADLTERKLKAVGDPDARFKEDALRILRAVRLCTQLGFSIESRTYEAILKDYHLIQNVSFERIRDEFFKILQSENAYSGVTLLDEIGILDLIFPELLKGKGVSQQRPGRHHTTDVFTHNILSLKECPTTDPLVKFAALLHDVGKPYVAATDSEGYIIFYNHEVVGAKIAKDIADRFRLSKKQKEKVYTLIRWHMFTVDEHITDSAVRRFIRRVGVENVKDMIDLRIGDRLGGGTQTAESWRLKKFKVRLEEQLNPPFSLNDLAIDGNDIMQQLSIPPGKQIGSILQQLFEEVDQDLSKNTKEYLIQRVHEISKES